MNVKFYMTRSCPWCKKTKEFLEKKKVKYKEIDVGKDTKAAKEMVAKCGTMGEPVLDIDGKIIVGFDKDKIEKTLKESE